MFSVRIFDDANDKLVVAHFIRHAEAAISMYDCFKVVLRELVEGAWRVELWEDNNMIMVASGDSGISVENSKGGSIYDRP